MFPNIPLSISGGAEKLLSNKIFFGALSGSGGGSLWERGGVFLGGENDGMIQNGRHGVV